MKTKSPLKIIFLFLAFLILFAGIVLVVAKRNLKPEAIRKVFTTQLQKSLPGAVVSTQSLDYSLGINSKVNIREVEILYPHGARKLPLCSFDNLQIEVPFWTMLLGYGTISINIDKPKVNYIEFKKGSNWENSFIPKEKVHFGEPKKKVVKKEKSEGTSTAGLAVLSFFSDATINFNVTNIEATYALKDGNIGDVKIDKLILKDIGLKTTTALELKSKFNLSKGTPSEISFDLLLIGETKLDNWLDEKKLDYNAAVNFNNISSSAFIKPLKQISLNMKGQVVKDDLTSNITVALEEHQFMKSKLNYDFKNNRTILNDIDLNTDLNNFISHFVNTVEFGAKINKGSLKLNGSLTSQNGKLTPDITTTIISDVDVLGIPVKINMKSNLGKTKIRSAIDLNTLGGNIKIGQLTPYTLGVDRIDYLKTSLINFHITDINIPTQLNGNKFIGAKKKELDKNEKISNKDTVNISGSDVEVFSKFPIKSKILFTNTMLGESPINGQLNFSVNRKQFNANSKKLKIGTAPLRLNIDSIISKKSKDTKLSALFTGVDISSAALFIPDSLIKSVAGKASGKIDGKVKNHEYDFNVDLNIKEAKISKINLSKLMGGIFDKVKHLTKKDLTVDGEITEIDFSGRFDDRLHQIKKFKAMVDDGKYVLNGSGKIDFKTYGEILGTIDVNDSELKQDLERDIGSSAIPFRLEGIGYNLSSDYKYTVEKVGKKAAENLLKKEVKKAVDKNKDKVKKMLKGIFK